MTAPSSIKLAPTVKVIGAKASRLVWGNPGDMNAHENLGFREAAGPTPKKHPDLNKNLHALYKYS